MPAPTAGVPIPGVAQGEVDLRHHGDDELAPGMVDFAVNVRGGTPPAWLAERIAASVPDLAAYPNPARARAAVAARHGRPPSEVLLTAGAAEAFTLIARAFTPAHAVVIHPQFTEPEAALRAAGHHVHRHVLREESGFRLEPAAIPETADLVVLGNPTNPTSVLHPADSVLAMLRPGRLVVVDEAFIDVVPGERESLAAHGLGGVIVVRSLTKTWGLAGLRVGYVLSSESVVHALARVQPHWSVSTPALVAAEACSSAAALAEAHDAAEQLAADRDYLVQRLSTMPGVRVMAEPAASFVLVEVQHGAALRQALRSRGFAVRRGETFPGLGQDWLRIAVREPSRTAALLAAWSDCRVRT